MLFRCGVLSLCLSPACLMGQNSECVLGEDSPENTQIFLELPAGQDQITCRGEMAVAGTGLDIRDFFFRGRPTGELYEASLEVTVDTTWGGLMPPDIDEGQPVGRFSTPYTTVPIPLRAGERRSWNTRHAFVAGGGGGAYPDGGWEIPVDISLHDLPDNPDYIWIAEMEFTMTLRRVKDDRCYMYTVVKGGSGAGTYFGDVAVWGNPMAVSDSTLDMWFGTDQGAKLKAFEDALNSKIGQEQMQGMSEEQLEAMQEFYGALDDAAVQADPIRELREMWTLTLQDVKFGELGPSAERGDSPLAGLAHIASKVVLVAQLADETGGVLEVGLKAPGLGLAGSNNPGCSVREPKLVVFLCDGDQPLELDAAGAVCGVLDAELCNEREETFEVTALFLAGRSMEQCIR